MRLILAACLYACLTALAAGVACDPVASLAQGQKMAPRERIKWYKESSDVCARANRFDAAATLRTESLRTRTDLIGDMRDGAEQPSVRDKADSEGMRPFDSILDLVAIAQYQRHLGLYSLATDALVAAERMVADSDNLTLAVLLKAHSELVDCAGNASDAVDMLNVALKMQRNAGQTVKTDDLLMMHRYLAHVVHSPPPPNARGVQLEKARAARAQLQLLTQQLVRKGGWEHPQQLPKYYVPGLLARPWHKFTVDFPQLEPVVRALRNAGDALRRDYRVLEKGGHLLRESECILEAGTGDWHYFTVTAPPSQSGALGVVWTHTHAEPLACSSGLTPGACALLSSLYALRVQNLTIHRAGFSILTGGSRLRPHFGLSNAQLKMHAGVLVPTHQNGTACARMRVGNDTRAWVQDRVLFFDDSFEHEVVNECADTRVVFQLVMAHPHIGDAPPPGVGSDGKSSGNPFQQVLARGH